MFTSKITSRIAKFASILALSTGLIAAGTTSSFAGGPPKPLIGALVGAGAGAGLGFVAGKGQGALIGGILGLAAGALVGNQLAQGHDHDRPTYTGYLPPAPVYAPGPVYAPTPVAYQPPAPQYPATQYAVQGAPFDATCRQFAVPGVPSGYQNACLQPDGTWHVID